MGIKEAMFEPNSELNKKIREYRETVEMRWGYSGTVRRHVDSEKLDAILTFEKISALLALC